MSKPADLAGAFADRLPGVSPGVYGEADFRAVVELVREDAGIVLPEGKAMLVYARLSPLVRASGMGTFKGYLALVRDDGEERRKMICALTTNHTFFYREAHHFEHFADVTRPALLQKLQAGEPVRMWSAGCSSGEECWSLVMTLLGPDQGAGRAIAKADLRILASDIDTDILARASAATYAAKDISAVPEALRNTWSTTTGAQATIVPEARELVQFRQLNLHGPWPMKKQFDVIFCRNVMIYFDTAAKERLVARFAQQLLPGGFLYIGHSERVSGAAEAELESVGPTIYQRRG